MITRTLTALALSTGVAAASVADNQEMLASKVDSANAHRGLEVTGAVRGVAQASYFNTDQDTYGKNIMLIEPVEMRRHLQEILRAAADNYSLLPE